MKREMITIPAAEFRALQDAISGVRVVANSGALKEFEGEPWLVRIQEVSLYPTIQGPRRRKTRQIWRLL